MRQHRNFHEVGVIDLHPGESICRGVQSLEMFVERLERQVGINAYSR